MFYSSRDQKESHSCQLKTGKWGYNIPKLTTTGQQKKADWYDICTIESEFGIKTWRHRSILPSGWFWWCNNVEDIFLAHLGPLSINWEWFKLHSLSIVADHIYLFMTAVWPQYSFLMAAHSRKANRVQSEFKLVSWTWKRVHCNVWNVLECHKELSQFLWQKMVQPSISKVYLLKWPVNRHHNCVCITRIIIVTCEKLQRISEKNSLCYILG